MFMRTFFSCCFCSENKSRSWVFQRAPEPTDIFWENMNVHVCKRIFNYIVSFIVTIIIMGLCFAFIQAVKSFKNKEDDDFKQRKKDDKDDISMYETGVAKIISWSASGAVVIVNEALLFVMRRITLAEEHDTMTHRNVSVALKLTIGRFLNSSLVLVFVNNDPKKWFQEGDLAYDATLLIGIMMFMPPFKMLIWYTYAIKKIKVWLARRDGDENCKITQREANILMEGTTTDPANAISEYMNLIMTCMFFSSIVPQAILVALFGSIISFWSLKYQLLRRDKMPEMFSAFMATFYANFLPYIVLIQTLAMFWFMKELTEAYKLEKYFPKRSGGPEDPRAAGTFAVILAIICLCCPFRTYINKSADAMSVLEDETKYEQKFLQF